MSYYASAKNGAVHLYKNGMGTPVHTFGHGSRITSALVSGDEIYCESESGNTFVYKINGNSANLIRTFR